MLRTPLAALAALSVLLPASVALAGAPAGLTSPPPRATPGQALQTGLNVAGDSLSCGKQDGSNATYPDAAGAALGLSVRNLCIGGQGSTQAAMRGGFQPIALTFSGNAISANTGANNVVTAINGVAIVGMATAQDPDYRAWATTGDDAAGQNYLSTGVVCGVHGTVKRYTIGVSGGPPSTSESVRFFSDYIVDKTINAAASVSCPAGSTFTPDVMQSHTQPWIFASARNNYSYPATVQADYQAFVNRMAAVGNTAFLCIGSINGEYASEWSGTSSFTTLTGLNTTLRGVCGAARFFDLRTWLIGRATSDIMDQQDVANGVIPYTTRAQVAAGTLSAALGTSGCPTLTYSSGSTIGGYAVIKVDGEYILVTTGGSQPGACTRGQGVGGAAASHSSGAAWTAVDPLHLNGTTYTAEGQYIAATYGPVLLPGSVSGLYLTPGALAAAFARGMGIGSDTVLNRLNGSWEVGRDLRLTVNGRLVGRTSNGDETPLAWITGTDLVLGATVGGFNGTVTAYTAAGMAWRGQGTQNFSLPKALIVGSTADVSSGVAGEAILSTGYTVSGLPACNAAHRGAVARVTDAAGPTYLGALTGGGTSETLAECDGSGWKAH